MRKREKKNSPYTIAVARELEPEKPEAARAAGTYPNKKQLIRDPEFQPSQPASPKSSVFVRSKSKRNLLKSPLFPDDDDDASYDWWRPPTRQFPKLFGRQQKKRRQRHQKPTEEKVKAIIEL